MNSAVTIRRIEFFACVAEELHFGRAADRLHIAQPTLSHQIRMLETELGLSLFERTTRHVRLTDAGRILYPEVKRLLSVAEVLGRVADQLKTGQRGLLRFGFVDSAAYELVPRFLGMYRIRWPDIQFDLRHMSSDDQIDFLCADELDLGIARAAGDSTLIRSNVFAKEPLYLAVHRRNWASGPDKVRLRDLAGQRFIGFDRDRSRSLHAEITSLLAGHSAAYSPDVEATKYTTILGIVAAGEGVAIVPAGVRTFRPPVIRYLKIVEKAASVRLILIARAANQSRLVGDSFDSIAKELGEIMASIHSSDLDQ